MMTILRWILEIASLLALAPSKCQNFKLTPEQHQGCQNSCLTLHKHFACEMGTNSDIPRCSQLNRSPCRFRASCSAVVPSTLARLTRRRTGSICGYWVSISRLGYSTWLLPKEKKLGISSMAWGDQSQPINLATLKVAQLTNCFVLLLSLSRTSFFNDMTTNKKTINSQTTFEVRTSSWHNNCIDIQFAHDDQNETAPTVDEKLFSFFCWWWAVFSFRDSQEVRAYDRLDTFFYRKWQQNGSK